jgi:hypothetical protein
MEKFKVTATSIHGNYYDAYVVEGQDLYYYLKRVPDEDYDSIYPCPVAQVAGRFRHDWSMSEGDNDDVPITLVARIKEKQLDPEFQELCDRQKEHFGQKRFEL